MILNSPGSNWEDDLNTIKRKVCQSGEGLWVTNYIYDKDTMLRDSKVPFIIQKGICRWNMPFSEVRVKDLVETFDGKLIVVELSQDRVDRDIHDERAIKKCFFNEWNSVIKSYRDTGITVIDKIRFKKYITSKPVSFISFIQSILVFSIYDDGAFERRFDCKKAIARSVLRCLGYSHYEIYKQWILDSELGNSIRGILNTANCIDDYRAPRSIRYKLNSTKYTLYSEISNFFQDKRDSAAIKITPLARRLKPVKGEKNRNIQRFMTCLIVTVFVLFTILAFCYTYNFFAARPQGIDYASWSQALGSFAGALLSGVAVIATTLLLIDQSYRVDYHTERMSVMPTFTLLVYTDREQFTEYKEGYYKKNIRKLFEQSHYIADKPVYLVFRNIGKGIAYNVEFREFNGDEEEVYLGAVVTDDEKAVIIESGCYSNLEIRFNDIYGNVYTQMFYCDTSQKETFIHEECPDIVLRTNRVRYRQ